MQGVELAGLDGSPVKVADSSLDSFRTALKGPVLRPQDEGYGEAVLIWNAMIQKRPALVARPQDTEDVRTCVKFARDNGIALSVKGGGHNIAGTSLADGGLTLDMSGMKRVEVDPHAKQAWVGAGCLLEDVDRVTQQHGLATVLGFVSQTGVAGLTLGGGFGYLSRRFGWTVDNLMEADVVTADGELRRASKDENPDLFWALRGGGGNLGVVTRFSFRLHAVGPQVIGGMIAWSAEHAEQVLALYREIAGSGPRALTMAASMRAAPPSPVVPQEWHGKPIVAIVACHSGDVAQAEKDLSPLKSFGRPILDLIVVKRYAEQQSMLDPTQPKGLNYYWKSEFVPGLPDGLLNTIRAQAAALTSPLSQMVLFHLGGAPNEFDPGETAFGNRDAQYVCNSAACWPPDDLGGERHRAWARSAWQAFSRYSTGGNYVNFQTDDEDETRTRTAYGENYERLSKAKSAYDPHNFFRTNRNVVPAPRTSV